MRKKWVYFLLSTLLLLFLGISPVFADKTYNVVVNGRQIDCNGYIQLVNGRLLVPLRALSESFGATVTWDQKTNTVVVNSKETTHLNLLKLNGEQTTWPYWYENGELFMEYRNAMELIRITHPALYYVIGYNRSSNMLTVNSVDLEPVVLDRDGFRLISLNYLKKKSVVNYEWDAGSGNLKLVPF